MWTDLLARIDVHPVGWAIACSATFIAAVTDLRSRRIHNVLTVPVFLGGLLWAVLMRGQPGVPGILEGLGAALLLGFPFIILFLYAGGGAGDAKIMMALGPWLGLAGGALVLVAVAISGIIVAVSFAVCRGHMKEVGSNLSSIGLSLLFVFKRVLPLKDVPRIPSPDRMRRVPYGLAIWIGSWVSALGVLLCHVQS